MTTHIVYKTIVSETLFWLHFGIILFALIIGLIFPWYIVLALAIAHRVHTWVFNGCVFSKIERRFGNLNHKSDYLQYMIKRFTGKRITPRQSKTLDYGLLGTMLMVTLIYNTMMPMFLPLSSIVLIGAALYGLIVSLFLTVIHKKHRCTNKQSCNPVLESRFATVAHYQLQNLVFSTIVYA